MFNTAQAHCRREQVGPKVRCVHDVRPDDGRAASAGRARHHETDPVRQQPTASADDWPVEGELCEARVHAVLVVGYTEFRCRCSAGTLTDTMVNAHLFLNIEKIIRSIFMNKILFSRSLNSLNYYFESKYQTYFVLQQDRNIVHEFMLEPDSELELSMEPTSNNNSRRRHDNQERDIDR